jgi:dihydrofolate synthase/folylpolyglutamate synthase
MERSEKYAECLRRIFTWNMFRQSKGTNIDRFELNLNSMLDLSSKFGNPHLDFKSIHIAGTNGKGSVTIKTATALQKLNFNTGMFISPHISTFRERITVNNIMITQDQVVEYSSKIM